MKRTIFGAAVAAMFLALSPMQSIHAAARVQQPDPQATADLNGQTVNKSANAASTKAKTLRRAYAIRARIAKQKTNLKSRKAKKQVVKSRKQSLKPKKKQAA